MTGHSSLDIFGNTHREWLDGTYNNIWTNQQIIWEHLDIIWNLLDNIWTTFGLIWDTFGHQTVKQMGDLAHNT